MSAAVAWDLNVAPSRVAAHLPGRAPARAPRPRLVLVPTGDAVPAARRGSLRLTRAGRLAITLAVAATLLALGVVAFAGSVGASSAAVADHAVTVSEGQTLSEIASRELPGLPVREAVAELQLANNLSSAHVHVGQVLVVPSRG